VIGLIGRLAVQKGWDLVVQVMQRWLSTVDAQWVILGTGEPQYHQLLSQLAAEWPNKVAARLEFSNDLAHRIEAGADMFLMPSQYEPCGLNQLYSLRYGAVPIVRATGGLADTITDGTDTAIKAGEANGFSFEPFEVEALEQALRRAYDTFKQRPDVWQKLVKTGMQQDWSWTNSARQYVQLYEKIAARRQQELAARSAVLV
jgi:starch synthase